MLSIYRLKEKSGEFYREYAGQSRQLVIEIGAGFKAGQMPANGGREKESGYTRAGSMVRNKKTYSRMAHVL